MTKKDYELAARTIVNAHLNDEAAWTVVNILCEIFSRDNPRFNRGTFLLAAGVVDGYVEKAP